MKEEMDFTQFKDINDFYEKTGMTREEALMFLSDEIAKLKLKVSLSDFCNYFRELRNEK